MRDGECSHALALPLYGARPSAGVCRVCEHYDGPARGAGDVVEKVARWTGVKAAVRALETATGRKCGCAGRRASLNRRIPFKSP